MTAPAERIKAMRAHRQASGLREARLLLPDARSRAVLARVGAAIARLDREDEADALAWIKSVAEFGEPKDAPPR